MKIIRLSILPLLGLAIALAGCASDSKKAVNLNLRYMTESSAPAYSSDPSAQAEIAHAASAVDRSLNQLSAIQVAKNPGVKMAKPVDAEAVGMSKTSSLEWYGPALPAVKRIAKSSGYSVRVLGSEPPTPVLVNISARHKTLADILRDITYQTANTADIKIYPDSRVIEFRYRG